MQSEHPPPIEQTVFEETQTLWLNPIIRGLIPVSAFTTTMILFAVGVNQPRPSQVQLASVWAAVMASELLLPWVLRVRTRVTDRTLRVAFVPFCRRRIPLDQIDEAEAIRYEPMREAGGWGLKKSARLGLVFTTAGYHAVRVVAGERRLLVGSQRAGELERAILCGAPRARAAAAERQDHRTPVPMIGGA